MIRKRSFIATCLMTALVAALTGGASRAQQTTPTDIWQLAPSNSLLVAGFDGRPGNASMQALTNAEDPETRDLRAKQQAAMRKAVESFATLFGMSLDFAKDIQSWAGQQWAFVLLPGGKDKVEPVFMIASNDAVAANAALVKMLAPWQRVGDVTPQPDSDYPITAFKTKDKRVEVYASASGPLVAFSPSKASLKQALKGGGFAAGSPPDRVLKALSGSMFYVFADPALLKLLGLKNVEVPVTRFGLGLSAVETGMMIRILGFPNDEGAKFLKQTLPTRQAGALVANPGIPSASLVTASFPNLNGLVAMAGTFGMSKDPIFGAAEAIGDTQMSAAITAVLPAPAGVISAMAASDQAAADKLAKITASLKRSKLPMKPAKPVSGVQATAIAIPRHPSAYLAQIGKHIVLASDAQSLAGAAATIKGEQPGIALSDTYKETIAGLGDSNLLTLYVNLAPIQGLGFLVDGLGIGQVEPFYGAIAKGLENLQALGVGAGYDGEAASATVFLRAKPGMGAGIGPAVVSAAAVGAAVLLPVFTTAREQARRSDCASKLKQLAMAAQIYASDHAGKLPTSARWQAQLRPYVRSELKCPAADTIYAFNKNLGGLNVDRIQNPSSVIMFFEAKSGLPNASGSRANAILPHGGWGVFAYADGHVQSQTEVPGQSQWVPKYAAPRPVKKAPAKKVPVYRRGG